MQRRGFKAACCVLLTALVACNSVPAPTPTSAPAAPAVTATRTPRPTSTKRPPPTPNATATQRTREFREVLRELAAAGYIESTQGRVTDIQRFEKELAKNDLHWDIQDVIGPDFAFSAHFRWSVEGSTMGVSGCGLIFGMQEDGSAYSVFLDDTRLQFLAYDAVRVDRIEPSSGANDFDFPNPAEADFTLAVRGQNVFVLVDGELTTFKLRETHDAHGAFGPAMSSSTTQGYGTRCTITGAKRWLPQ